MAKVLIHRHAARYLQRLPQPLREKVKQVLAQLGDEALRHKDVRPMLGEWAGYQRLRIGSLRVIFWFDEDQDKIFVDHIGPRGDVYK